MNSSNTATSGDLRGQQQKEGDAGDNVLRTEGAFDRTRAFTELHLADGRVLRLDTRTLMPDASMSGDHAPRAATRSSDQVAIDETITIPLIEEHLVLDKRVVETGKVRLHKTVQEFEQQLDEPLAVNTFDVERVILNQVVESPPEIRQEGETTIYSLVEEQLVLSRQLVLKEEVRVTRRVAERRDTQVVRLRRDHLTVEREDAESADRRGGGDQTGGPWAGTEG